MSILHMPQQSAIQAHKLLSYLNHQSFCQHPGSIYDYIHVTVRCVTICNKLFSVFLAFYKASLDHLSLTFFLGPSWPVQLTLLSSFVAVYSTLLSIIQATQCHMVGQQWRTNKKSYQKKWVWHRLIYYPVTCLEGIRKWKTSVRIGGVTTQTVHVHLLN